MRRRAHPLLWSSILLTAAALAAMVWTLTLPAPPLRECRLPDGTILRLEAISLGPEHRLVRGRYWQRLLAPFLQGPLATFGPSVTTWRLPVPNAAVIWLTWKANSPLTNWTHGTAVDDWGDEVELTGTHIQFMRPDGPDEKLCGWVAPAFPRRGREIELRLYNAGQPAPVAVFRVPNPTPEPHSTWTATPLPATQSAGGLAVTLTGLETSRAVPASVPPERAGRYWTRAEFRVRENGRPTDRWEPIGAALSDATGNIVTPPATPRPGATGAVADWEWAVHRHAGGAAQLAFEGNLPPKEAAWKLRVEFAPTRSFTPAEIIRIRQVPVPARGGRLHPLRANRLSAAGVDAEVERPSGAPVGALTVAVRQSASKEGVRVGLFRAFDDRGREFALDEPGLQFLPSRPDVATVEFGYTRLRGGGISGTITMMPAPYSSRFYTLRGAPGARSLDLTLASVKSRFVEFVVRPSLTDQGQGN